METIKQTKETKEVRGYVADCENVEKRLLELLRDKLDLI